MPLHAGGLAQAAAPRVHDGRAAGQRLERGQTEALQTTGHHEARGAGDQGRHVRVVHVAGKVDARREAEFLGVLAERLEQAAVGPRQHEPAGLLGQSGPGVEKDAGVLPVVQHAEEQRVGSLDAEALAHRRDVLAGLRRERGGDAGGHDPDPLHVDLGEVVEEAVPGPRRDAQDEVGPLGDRPIALGHLRAPVVGALGAVLQGEDVVDRDHATGGPHLEQPAVGTVGDAQAARVQATLHPVLREVPVREGDAMGPPPQPGHAVAEREVIVGERGHGEGVHEVLDVVRHARALGLHRRRRVDPDAKALCGCDQAHLPMGILRRRGARTQPLCPGWGGRGASGTLGAPVPHPRPGGPDERRRRASLPPLHAADPRPDAQRALAATTTTSCRRSAAARPTAWSPPSAGAEGFVEFANPEFNVDQHAPIYIYDRLDEPARGMLEENLAQAEGGDRCVCFATGMAAISGRARAS